MKSTRDAFGDALEQLGGVNRKIVTVDADLSGATRSNLFNNAFPERSFQVGIAEANAVSIAAGLAIDGYVPVVPSFGAFLTGNAYDQIRVSVAYNKAPVVLVGTHAGLAIGKDGATQMGIEDIALMRVIPDMQVIQPADAIETEAALRYLTESGQPGYLRICRQPMPIVNDQTDYQFQVGKNVLLKAGRDAVIYATGGTVGTAMEAAGLLEQEGLSVQVTNVHSFKPVDKEGFLADFKKFEKVVTIEDHSVIGGLASVVAEVSAENGCSITMKSLGIQDKFGESGAPDDLYRHYELDSDALVSEAKQLIGIDVGNANLRSGKFAALGS